MNLNTENLRSVAAYPLPEPEGIPGWMLEMKTDEWLRKVNPDDIAQELFSDDRFGALLLQADATLLGLHVLRVRRDYAQALALRDLEAA
jgi:hypothetical protein